LFVQFNSNVTVTQGLVTLTDDAAGGSSTYVTPTGGFYEGFDGMSGNWSFYCSSVKSGVTTITANISGSPTISFNSLAVEQYSGLSAYTFDVAKSASAGLSSATDGWTTGNFTTTTDSDFVWGMCSAGSGAGTFSAGTGFTFAGNFGNPTFELSEYKTAGAAGSYAATFTNTSATPSGVAMAMAFSPPSILLMGQICM
jgi:hypothetical protein